MSSPPVVLITGANGFLGYACLVGALKAGYHVRAAVRRKDAIEQISKGPSVQNFLSSGALTFALVPDNTKPHAYNEAAKDCSYIMHMASPLPLQPGNLVPQAIAGTKAALEAAEATPSIKRVVFTSSTASTRTIERLLTTHPANQAILSGKGDEVLTITAETLAPMQSPVPDDAEPIRRYNNSKIAAAHHVHNYATTSSDPASSAHFSIVNLKPGYVFGVAELARTKSEAFAGSNIALSWLFDASFSLGPFMGLPADGDAPLLAETVHLDDVVEAHVKALDIEKVPGKYRNFYLCSDGPEGPVMMDAVEVVRREFPREVKEGRIPVAGKLGTIPHKFDAAPAERDLLGHPFKDYREQVRDTVGWLVHLPD